MTTNTIEFMDLDNNKLKSTRYTLRTCGCGRYWKEIIAGLVLLICLVVAGMALGLSVYQNHVLSLELEDLRAQINSQTNAPYVGAQKQPASMTAAITRLISRVKDVEEEAAALRNQTLQLQRVANYSSSTAFIHWGKQRCGDSEELVYSGFGAGSTNDHDRLTGGGVNYLCMTPEPEYNKYDSSNDSIAFSWVYAAEYISYSIGIFDDSVHGGNMACSVCRVPRSSQVMIPGKRTCPDDWTKEYEGYIMSSMVTKSKSDYICVDEKPDSIPHVNSTGASMLFFASGFCGGGGTLGHCPPYVHARELTCVICTK